jgi:hypothetical protein
MIRGAYPQNNGLVSDLPTRSYIFAAFRDYCCDIYLHYLYNSCLQTFLIAHPYISNNNYHTPPIQAVYIYLLIYKLYVAYIYIYKHILM